jgi:aminopeptidase N
VSEDLRKVIEEVSGRNFDQFFDQWLYHGYFPELKITYSWDQQTRLAKINVKQTQPVNESVVLFRLPVVMRFEGDFGSRDTAITVKDRDEDFYFPLPGAPKIARFDPDYTLLAKIAFPLSKPMLYAQIENTNDMIGRVLAMDQLAGFTDRETIAKLKHALNGDSFYGARIEASRALRTIHTDEALQALADSMKQDDARARRAVVTDIAAFYSDVAYKAERNVLEKEKNPDVIAPALKGFAEYSEPDVDQTLKTHLESKSFRNEIADSAIVAMRCQNDPRFIADITNHLSADGANFTTRGIAQALDTVAFLERNEDKKDAVRRFLSGYVTDKRERVQIGALSALGTLGDDVALPVLEPFASAIKDSPVQAAAEKAVAKIRESRKPSDDLKELRQEVLALEKRNSEIRKDFEDLRKQAKTTESRDGGKQRKNVRLNSPKS